MKKFLIGFLLGIGLLESPDLLRIYADYEIGTYQRSECYAKGFKPNDCYFNMYFYKYQKEHPMLDAAQSWLLFGEGQLYFITTRRCSNDVFYNPSATKRDSGKITNRDYFYGKCSRYALKISDVLFGKKQK